MGQRLDLVMTRSGRCRRSFWKLRLEYFLCARALKKRIEAEDRLRALGVEP